MKKFIKKALVGILLAAQVVSVSDAKADELEQLRAQIKVVSDVIDAKIYEFSKKSTDKPAFDHADYSVARQRYYANMRAALQVFKEEVLAVYGRFEPYFQVANSSFYTAAQKNQILFAEGAPLASVIQYAQRDYMLAFEKLLGVATGNPYMFVRDAKKFAPVAEPFQASRKLYVCRTPSCQEKMVAPFDPKYNLWRTSTSLVILEDEIIKANQRALRSELGCQAFHCFALMKSDISETILNLWLEFGQDYRRFTLDKAGTMYFPFAMGKAAGLISTTNFESYYRLNTASVNGRYLYEVLNEHENRVNAAVPEDKRWQRQTWANAIICAHFFLVDLNFSALVTPVDPAAVQKK